MSESKTVVELFREWIGNCDLHRAAVKAYNDRLSYLRSREETQSDSIHPEWQAMEEARRDMHAAEHALRVAALAEREAGRSQVDDLERDARRWRVARQLVPVAFDDSGSVEGWAFACQIPLERIHSATPCDLLDECIDKETEAMIARGKTP